MWISEYNEYEMYHRTQFIFITILELTPANVDQWTVMDYKHGSQMQITKNLCTEVM